MQLRAELIIEGLIKTLENTIQPALEPTNGLAREQLGIAIKLLEYMACRLPLQYDFDHQELSGLTKLAQQLVDLDEFDSTLANELNRSRDVLERARCTPDELVKSAIELRSAITSASSNLFRKGGDVARQVERAVLDHAREALRVERSWLAPTGFEHGSEPLPAVESLLLSTKDGPSWVRSTAQGDI